MKVVIDDHIPYIKEAAEWLFDEVAYLPGNAFHNSREVKDADALIIRTRTRCDETLLSDSRVSYVVTATIGYDHIDTAFMQRAGIEWANCPGCNATSVAQYVRNSLLQLSLLREDKRATPPVVGIVGYGHVGKAVRQAVEAFGCKVMLNDPPLYLELSNSRTPELPNFQTLESLAEQCDVITFHTPLTTEGEFPTFHLADESFFRSLKRKPVIINTARGGVVDERALLRAYDKGLVSAMIIDTWEGEPRINRELLQKAVIATPHIAGYSADGKSNASRMALRAVCRHFGIAITDQERFLALTAPPKVQCSMFNALTLYNPMDDSAHLKAAPNDFEALRNNYPLRRETVDC